jgi:hypothetical protein
MEKIPTAEELIEKTGSHEFWQNFHLVKEDLKESMIEFAKLHVEAALKAVADEYYPKELENFELVSGRFIKAYSLENIK